MARWVWCVYRRATVARGRARKRCPNCGADLGRGLCYVTDRADDSKEP